MVSIIFTFYNATQQSRIGWTWFWMVRHFLTISIKYILHACDVYASPSIHLNSWDITICNEQSSQHISDSKMIRNNTINQLISSMRRTSLYRKYNEKSCISILFHFYVQFHFYLMSLKYKILNIENDSSQENKRERPSPIQRQMYRVIHF